MARFKVDSENLKKAVGYSAFISFISHLLPATYRPALAPGDSSSKLVDPIPDDQLPIPERIPEDLKRKIEQELEALIHLVEEERKQLQQRFLSEKTKEKIELFESIHTCLQAILEILKVNNA